jgi:hypothetical protein
VVSKDSGVKRVSTFMIIQVQIQIQTQTQTQTHPSIELSGVERQEHNEEGEARLLDAAHGLHLMAEQDCAHASVADEHGHEEHDEVEEVYGGSLYS